MDDKLQKLTDRLYREGVEKGEEEGESIVAAAGVRADEIVAGARKEAEEIIASAKKSAKELKERVESEIRLSGMQAIRTFKKEIEDVIVAEALDENLSEAMNDLGNIEDYVKTVIQNWHPERTESPTLELLLPEKRRKELEEWFKSEVGKVMAEGIDIRFHKNIKGGFQIASIEGGYRINLTDEDFLEFFKHYLKPRTRELLFGEG